MRISHRFIIAAVAAVTTAGITACDQPGAPGSEHIGAALTLDLAPACPIQAGTCVPVAPAVTEAEACPRDRWIAYLGADGGTCPEPPPGGNWAGGSLFEPVGKGPGWDLAPGLRPFCAYDWTGAAPPSQLAINVLLARLAGEAEEVEPDCEVLRPMSSEIVDQSWEQLRDHVHAHVGRLDPLPMDPTVRPRTVRVAVLDSVPTGSRPGSGNPGESPHGWAVGHTIHELGCPRPQDPSSACISSISTHLALPLDASGEEDRIHGGTVGRITDLAVSMVDAVNAWRIHNHGRSQAAPDYHMRLVANISVAWEDDWGGVPVGPNGSSLSPRTRAVYAAIKHLRCFGGIAIAAAGNDPGGPVPATGGMLPARWETEPAPTAQSCGTFEGSGYASGLPPLFPPAGTYNPLVHAVGAVAADDQPITATRPGGRPRLAALGAHVVAADLERGGTVPTAVQTGTSMAAAITSGIVSAAWGYDPNQTGAQLMAQVWGAGANLGQLADFCLGGQPCPLLTIDPQRRIRRVELCSSIEAVCDAGGSHCPSQPLDCTARPAGSGALPVPTAVMRAAIDSVAKAEAGVHSAAAYDESLPPLDVCDHDGYQTSVARYDVSSCPFRQWGLQSVPRPHSSPQPGGNPCPACWLSLRSTADGYRADLHISIVSDYPYAVTGGTVFIPDHPEVSLAVVGTLEPGEEAKVIDIPLEEGGQFKLSTINFRDADIQTDGTFVPLDSATSDQLIVSIE